MSALAMVAINGKPRRHEPSHAAALALRKLHKRFGDKSVLNGIDLAIEPGQFVAIVGKSGCGKSTLLRLIAGLDTPSAGKIEFDNKPSDGLRSDVRVMFQEPRLLPWATVQRNVEVGLLRSALNIGKSTTAYSALAEVGLSDRAGDWPAVLSGGQRQRVSLARALVSKPRLLALDEPLGALDALTRLEMQDLLERVWREQGFTALLVTHDLGEAIALADRVIVIEAGTVALDLHVDIPRPRRRHPEQLALLEEEVLRRLLAPVTPSTQNSPTHDSSPTHS